MTETLVAEDEGYTVTEIAPNAGMKIIHILTDDAPVGGTDNVTVDLSLYGCTNVHAVMVSDETTEGSVVVNQDPTATSVSSSVLTVDLGGGATGIKSIIIYAY